MTLVIPTTPALEDGTRLRVLGELPSVGDCVIIYGRGRFYSGVVVGTGPVRAHVAYGTPTGSTVSHVYVRVDSSTFYARAFVVDATGPYAVRVNHNKRYGHSLVDASTGLFVVQVWA